MKFCTSALCRAALGVVVLMAASADASAHHGVVGAGGTDGGGRRSRENAIAAAEDAFGTSIGRETIGLYDSGSVRGFSPTTAGNVRVEGLYFDQQGGLNVTVVWRPPCATDPWCVDYCSFEKERCAWTTSQQCRTLLRSVIRLVV